MSYDKNKRVRARVLFFWNKDETREIKKSLEETSKPLLSLVGDTGFEPVASSV